MENNAINLPEETTLNIKSNNELDIDKSENKEQSNATTIITEDTIDTQTDCLAIVVRESYHTKLIKNITKKTIRISLKIALSTLVLNFLNMFI